MTAPYFLLLAALWIAAIASVILVVRFWRRPRPARQPMPMHLLDAEYWKSRPPIFVGKIDASGTIDAGHITASKIEADSER